MSAIGGAASGGRRFFGLGGAARSSHSSPVIGGTDAGSSNERRGDSSESELRRVAFDCSSHWAGWPPPEKLLLLHSQKLLVLDGFAFAVWTLEVVVEVVVELRSRRDCAADGPNACELLLVGCSVAFLEEVSRLGKSSELSSQARTWKVLLGN
jgi:hypothetical protein